MRKTIPLMVGLALVALAGAPWCRADYSNTVMSFNPVAYWPLNETNQPPAAALTATNVGTLGTIGNGNISGVAFSLTSPLAGVTDKAMSLSSAAVTTPYNTNLTLKGSFSAEGWFNPDDDGTTEACLSCGELGGNRSGWLIYKLGGGGGWSFRLYDQNGGNATINIAGGDTTPGVWHHVVATWDGTTASVYVDGVLANSGTITDLAPVPNTDGNFTIGVRSDGAFPFPGGADEVALYTNLLSAADVLAHYQNGTNAARGTPYNNLVLSKNPLLYFRLNEGISGNLASLPVATNYGSLGPVVNGKYYPGTEPGVVGPPGTGFGSKNFATHFVPARGSGVECGNDAGLDIGTNAMTVVCWFKGGPTDYKNRFQSPLGRSDASWRMDVDWFGQARFVSGSPDCVGSTYINDNVWHFYAGVFDGTEQYIYIDGLLDGEATGSGGSDPGAKMRIGGVGDYGDRYFNGSIAQVAVFASALTPANIETLYGSSAAPITVLRQPAAQTNYAGLNANLNVYAVGATSYQWQKGGVNLAGQTTNILSFSPLAVSDTGDYKVILNNAAGIPVSSSTVHLTVNAAAPTALDISSNLVLHLKFDNDSLDYSGRGNNGVNVGGPSYVTGGIIGSHALEYSTDTGANTFKYVTLGVRPDLQFSSNVNFTVSYWIRYPTGATQSGDLPVICNVTNSSYNPGYTFFQDSGNWGWTLDGNTPGQTALDNIGSGSYFLDGNWHHVALACDRTGYARTYFDGSEMNAKPIAEISTLDTGAATIIGQDPTGTYGVSGTADIADVGVWKRVLGPGEIGGIYMGGISNHVSFVASPLPPITITSLPGQKVRLSWSTGVLQSAPQVTGTYNDVSGATSPYTNSATGMQFYRLRQ